MMRPSNSTLVIGYPVVTGSLLLLDGVFGFETIIGNAPAWVGIVALFCAAGLAKASSDAARYRAWRREWDAMDPNAASKPKGQPLKIVGVFIIASLWLYAFSTTSSPTQLIAILVAVRLLGIWAVTAWSKRRRAQPSCEWLVAQSARRPLPAPSAKDAYAALPDYCRPLLNP